MTESLLPCPFCSGTRGNPKLEELLDKQWRVICYGCLIKTVDEIKKDAAIERWNRRTVFAAREDSPLSNRQIALLAADWLQCNAYIERQQVYIVLNGLQRVLDNQAKLDELLADKS
jgi:hypothetical protein